MSDHFGIHGATSSSWERELNVRPFVKELQEKYPEAGFSELWRRFSQLMLDDSDARDAAAHYVIKNCWDAQRGYATRAEEQDRDDSVSQKPERKTKTQEDRATEKVRLEAATEALDKQLQAVYRLDMLMPNGKKLRNCTADDLRTFGADYLKMADRIGTGSVGDTFADDTSLGAFANH